MPRAITTICAFAALILSFVSILAQEAKPAEEQRTPWFDHWRYSVFSFGVIATDDHTKRNFFRVIGTGFIVSPDEHTGYFFTAKHVIPIRLKQVAQLLREGGGHGRHRPA
jgi:hypothetical protein